MVTSLSKNAKFHKKDKYWEILKKDKEIICNVEGEYTNHLKFENVLYWEYQKDAFPPIKRMAFTLPSDSTFRHDLIYFKQKDDDMSQLYKLKLEEIQRNDKKLREAWKKKVEKEEKEKKKKEKKK